MLFRREALQGQQHSGLGRVQVLPPLSLTLLTAVAVGSVALVVSFLCTAEYTRKARVSGYLVPDRGVLRIQAPQSATVLSREVGEGQTVKAGDVLFVLALDSASQTIEGIAQTLQSRQLSLQGTANQQLALVRTQLQTLTQKRAGLLREQAQLQVERQLHGERLALARESLERQENLARNNFISPAQLQSKREELLGLQSQTQSLARQGEALQRDLQAAEAQMRELPLRSEVLQAEIARDLAELKEKGLETEGRRRLVLRAPSDGIVSTLLAADAGPAVRAFERSRLFAGSTSGAAALPGLSVPKVRPAKWARASGLAHTASPGRAGHPQSAGRAQPGRRQRAALPHHGQPGPPNRQRLRAAPSPGRRHAARCRRDAGTAPLDRVDLRTPAEPGPTCLIPRPPPTPPPACCHACT
jgi:membrane fusion protein